MGKLIITTEMLEAAKTLVTIHDRTFRQLEPSLSMTEEELKDYWNAKVILNGVDCNVFKEGKITLRIPAYNEDRKAG